jgi:hypothetical protein
VPPWPCWSLWPGSSVFFWGGECGPSIRGALGACRRRSPWKRCGTSSRCQSPPTDEPSPALLITCCRPRTLFVRATGSARPARSHLPFPFCLSFSHVTFPWLYHVCHQAFPYRSVSTLSTRNTGLPDASLHCSLMASFYLLKTLHFSTCPNSPLINVLLPLTTHVGLCFNKRICALDSTHKYIDIQMVIWTGIARAPSTLLHKNSSKLSPKKQVKNNNGLKIYHYEMLPIQAVELFF